MIKTRSWKPSQGLPVETRQGSVRAHPQFGVPRCFARRGHHATTVDDIATEASVSKGAPYVYFESKEAQLCDSWDCGPAVQLEAAIARVDGPAQSPRRALENVALHCGEIAVLKDLRAETGYHVLAVQ